MATTSRPTVLASSHRDVSFPKDGFYQYIYKRCLGFGQQVALIDATSGKEVTYSEIITLTERAAYHLHQHGVRQGDVFALCAPNSATYAILILALTRLGAVCALVSALSSFDELKHCLTLGDARFLFGSKQHSNDARDILSGTKVEAMYVEEDERTASLFEPIPYGKTAPLAMTLSSDDVCGIMFSSGTSGLPKAVEMTHAGFIAQAFPALTADLAGKHLEGSIQCMPMSHTFGFTLLFSTLAIGGFSILMQRFSFEKYLQIVAKYKVRKLHLVPPVLVLLAKNQLVDQYDIGCIEEIVVGAAPVSAELEHGVKAKLGQGVHIKQAYGMTECCGLISITPSKSKHNPRTLPGSVGILATNTQLKVVDIITGSPVGANTTGELFVKSDHLMKKYKGNPKATRETLSLDGWLRTGDVGYYDAQGNIFIVDRIKELIKYKAYQVAPAELEGVLLKHPDVVDVGVIGVPDLMAGELPCAWVVRKPGSTVTENDIQNYASGKLAPYKRLRGGVKFVTQIPKSPSGKILRRLMRDRLHSKL